MLGRDFVLETFRQYGVEYLFGNPGTTELPLMDGLVNYPDIEFKLALHEDIAVGMAAGYSHATGKPGVINLHATPGLAHGLGNIYNAYRSGVPLVVTAGQHDSRLNLQEPGLSGETKTMAKGFTKWSWEINRVEELPIVLHRAFKEAMTEPMGPVFISFPSNVMLEEIHEDPIPLTVFPTEHRGDKKATLKAISELKDAKNPIIVAGDRIGRTKGAMDALVSFTNHLGIPVYQEHQSSSLNFPYSHPHFVGRMLPNGPAIQDALKEADVVVFLGVISQAPLLYFDQPLVQKSTKVIAVDQSTWEIGKNRHVHHPILANPKNVLEEWIEWLEENLNEEDHQRINKRKMQLEQQKDMKEKQKLRDLEENIGKSPLSPMVVIAELNKVMSDDVMIVDEAITTNKYVHSYLSLNRQGSVIALKGGGLGYGMPAALGAQLGRPEERVLAIIGDGSAYYYIQSLWNAAKYSLPVIYVIVNNTSYMILKGGMLALKGESAKKGLFPGMDLDQPAINIVNVAKGLGIDALKIETYEELQEGIKAAFEKKRPILLDVTIDREVKQYLA